MRTTCTIPQVEASEVVDFTRTIDERVVHILSTLVGHNIAQDIVMDLAEIASASLYIRGQAEQALERGEKKTEAAQAEVTS